MLGIPRVSRVGVTLNLAWVRAATNSAIDLAAARRVDGIANRIFLDPMLQGSYPADVQQATATLTDWSFVADGDEEICCQPLDLIGLNYYSPTTVRAHLDDGVSDRVDNHG